MIASTVLFRLRQATAARHRMLEEQGDVEARLRDPAARARTVAALLALHGEVEAAIQPWRAFLAATGFVLEPRAPALRAALARLGGRVPEASGIAAAGTLGDAIGRAYVVEGSALGGRVMRRAMVAEGVDLTGLEFLDPWGEETGSRWRAFLAAMESACASGQALPADVVRGGVDAFDLASRLLVPPLPEPAE